MDKKQKELLKKVLDGSKGLYSPAEMINVIAGGNEALINELVVKGYLEEVPKEIPDGTTLNFYRISHKGLIIFKPWYEKLWFYFSGDIRTIIITIVTATITTIITTIIGNKIN